MTVPTGPTVLSDGHSDELATLVDLLPALSGGSDDTVEVTGRERLRRGVHRLHLAGAIRPTVVVKRVRTWKSRLEQQLTDRWLPGAQLDGLGPPRVAILAEPDGRYVWHIYDDLGPWGLDQPTAATGAIEAALGRVADLHARFANHAMLPEPRFAAGDLGVYFYSKSVRDAARAVARLHPPAVELSASEQQVRDDLLERLHLLLDDEPERIRMIEQAAGPETLLHGDLTTANVFVLPGPPVVRLIDWDHVGVGPAAFDISTHLSYYPADKRRGVLDRYTAAMADRGYAFGADVDWDRLLATFEAGRLANQIIWVAICLLDDDGWTFEHLAQWNRSLAAVVDGTVAAGGPS